MEIEYLFYHSKEPIPQSVVELLKNSYDTEYRTFDINYIIFDGAEIELFTDGDSYYPIISSVNKYLRAHDISMQYRPQIISEINELLPAVEILQRKEIREQELYSPVIPYYYYDSDHAWVAYAIDINRQKIFAEYYGKAKYDKIGRLYNMSSIITIHPSYQGRGLCSPFAAFSYSQVIDKLPVKYFIIRIAAANKYAACKCYVAAALNAKLLIYISSDGVTYQQITNKEQCDIYNIHPDTEMILTDGIEYDNMMYTGYT